MKPELLEALFDVQQNLKVAKNEEAKNFKYRTCEGILTALKPLLAPHKGVVWFSDQIVVVDGWKYLESTAHLQVGDDELECKALAREAEKQPGMNPAQVTGSSSSYARKYALCAMFGIDDGNDPDSQSDQQQNNNQRNNKKQQSNNNQKKDCKFFNQEETTTIRNAYKTHKKVYDEVCKNFNVKLHTDIPNDKVAKLFYGELIKRVINADKGGK